MKKYTINLLIMIAVILTACNQQEAKTYFHTVTGDIEAEQLGYALTHEHIMSNFGEEIDKTNQYEEDSLLNQIVPYLKQLNALGVKTVFDCTTQYFGRRVDLLQRISNSSGIQVVTNTGIYGSANDRYIPAFAYEESPKQLAARWIDEFENGIDDTDIKPGFIKLAFDGGTPSEIDLKLFESGIITHLSTGLTMAVHTSNNPDAATAQLELLKKYQVSPEAWVWVHANKITDFQLLVDAAKQGAWVSLDGVKSNNIEEYVEKLQRFKELRLLHKILLSHDGNGFPRGGEIRKFDAIPKYLIPRLETLGFTQEEINQLMVTNPATAFKISIRKWI